jgi:hypothetical protein
MRPEPQRVQGCALNPAWFRAALHSLSTLYSLLPMNLPGDGLFLIIDDIVPSGE